MAKKARPNLLSGGLLANAAAAATSSPSSEEKIGGNNIQGQGGSLPSEEDDPLFGSATREVKQVRQEIEAIEDTSTLPHIAIAVLHDNPFQPRRTYKEASIQELADEIKENGFQGAIAARPHPEVQGAYQIVFGHRRKRAAEQAGLVTLPIVIKDYDDDKMRFLAVTENLLREALTPMDEAYTYQSMLDAGYTQDGIAGRIKRSRGYVRNRLELLKVPQIVQDMVEQDAETVRAAYHLRDVTDEAMLKTTIDALLAHEITGTMVPVYLEKLSAQKQAQLKLLEQQASTQQSAPQNGAVLGENGTSVVQGKKSNLDASAQPSTLHAPVNEHVSASDIAQLEPVAAAHIPVTDSEELKRTSQMKDLQKRFGSYQRALRDSAPSTSEINILEILIKEMQQILDRSND